MNASDQVNRSESTYRLETIFSEDQRVFASYEEIEEWLAEEADSWRWLTDLKLNRDFASQLTNGIKRVRNAMNPPSNQKSNQDRDAQVQSALTQWKTSGPKFTSRSVFGKLVCAIADTDPELASATAWAMFEKPRLRTRDPTDFPQLEKSVGGRWTH